MGNVMYTKACTRKVCMAKGQNKRKEVKKKKQIVTPV